MKIFSIDFIPTQLFIVQFVRTYVIHFLGTYVTILCNWLILWQNILYLYLDRIRICLILQEILFQDWVLKHCKSVQDSSLSKIQVWKVSVIKVRQLAIYQGWGAVPAPWLDSSSIVARQIGYLLRFMKNRISDLFWL